MSDTTELFTGSSGAPEASPGFTGGTPAPAGETVTDKPTRRGGSGLSGMLLADLQRLAQSMGITGTGRMRKSQLIEAIQSRQGGGSAAQASGPPAGPPAGNGSGTLDNSVQRGASAGAGTPRHREQDAMESDTTAQPALGGAAQPSGPAQEAATTAREARRGGSRDAVQASTGQASTGQAGPPDRVPRPAAPTASSRSPRPRRRRTPPPRRTQATPLPGVRAPGGPTGSPARTASAATGASVAGVTTRPVTGASSATASVTVTSVTAARVTAASATTTSGAAAGTASAARR